MWNYSTRIDSQELFIFPLVIIYIYFLSFQKPRINSELYFPGYASSAGSWASSAIVRTVILDSIFDAVLRRSQWSHERLYWFLDYSFEVPPPAATRGLKIRTNLRLRKKKE